MDHVLLLIGLLVLWLMDLVVLMGQEQIGFGFAYWVLTGSCRVSGLSCTVRRSCEVDESFFFF